MDPEREIYRTRLQDIKEKTKALEDDIEAITMTNLWAGKIIATGGYRRHQEGWPLAWALFAPPKFRQMPNLVS